MTEAFLLAWIGVIAAQSAPDPNFLAVVEAALGAGRRTALSVVAGVSVGMLFWPVGMALGLGALLVAVPISLVMLKLLGGGYLLWMALRGAVAAIRGGASTPGAGHPVRRAGFRRGFLVVMTNPKAALMWGSVAAFLFGRGLAPMDVVAFGPLAALSSAAIYGGWAILFSTGAATRVYRSVARGAQGLFAAAFAGMGITLVWSGLKEVRP